MNLTRVHIYPKKKDSIVESRNYQAISKQGKRSYNEDRYTCKTKMSSPFILSRHHKRQEYDFFAVFDGHGGSQCSEFLR